MAVTLTAAGARVTSGRGASKTVVLDVSFAQLERWARRMKVDAARVWRKAYGSALRSLKSQFQKIVAKAGGVEGLPKFKDFEQFTKELRVAGNFAGKPMGGILADKRRIVSFKRNGWQIIGWPDALAKWAVKFQDGEGDSGYDPFADPVRRANWHALGIRDIPRSYVHNERRVLPEPFGAHVRKNLQTWAQRVYYKQLAQKMAKGTP